MATRTTTSLLASVLFGGVVVAVWFAADALPAPSPNGAGGSDSLAPGIDPLLDTQPGGRATPPIADVPQVLVEVRTRCKITAPAPQPAITVRRGQQILPALVRIAGGVGAQWPLPDRRPGRSLLRIEHGTEVWYRAIRFERPGAAVTVDLGPAARLRGSVVDEEQRPVAGAEVWCGGSPGSEIATGADGRFETTVAAGAGIPVVVRAAGRAWSSRLIDWQFDDGSELVFRLARECRLRVQLNAIVGEDAPLRGAVAAVVPLDRWSTELLQFPFYAQELFSEAWLDERGAAVLRGLPRGAVIGAVIRGPRLLATRVVDVDLRGEEVSVLVPMIARPLLRGRVVDERGDPVGGVELWCWPAGARARAFAADRWLMPPSGAPGGGGGGAAAPRAGGGGGGDGSRRLVRGGGTGRPTVRARGARRRRHQCQARGRSSARRPARARLAQVAWRGRRAARRAATRCRPGLGSQGLAVHGRVRGRRCQ